MLEAVFVNMVLFIFNSFGKMLAMHTMNGIRCSFRFNTWYFMLTMRL